MNTKSVMTGKGEMIYTMNDPSPLWQENRPKQHKVVVVVTKANPNPNGPLSLTI